MKLDKHLGISLPWSDRKNIAVDAKKVPGSGCEEDSRSITD